MQSLNQLNEVIELLKRNNELLTTIAKASLSNFMEKELSESNYRKLYFLTGNLRREILSRKLGMSAGSISALWKKWETAGLLIKDGKSYRRAI